MEERDLQARFDPRQSFYGKATEIYGDNGTIRLRSYNMIVAEIRPDGTAHVRGTYSPTTLRHIKEFLRQHGKIGRTCTKADIENAFMDND